MTTQTLTPEAAQSDAANPPRRGLRGKWFPVGVVVAEAALIAGISNVPPDTLPRGLDMAVVIFSLAAAVVALAVWFFVFSGARAGVKAGMALLGLLAVAAGVGSIRKVEFSGDMRPTFFFRWQQDSQDRLAAHLAAGGAASEPVDASFYEPSDADVLEYRGARRDGIVQGPALARVWSDGGLKPLWRQPVGGGYAAMVNRGRALVTIEQRKDREAVVCYDRETGRQQWTFDYPALFSESLGGDGPRATPTIVGDRVYALGATGVLACLELTTGKPLWQTNILEANEAKNIVWGMCGSPLVIDGLVIVNPGSQQGTAKSAALLAFDAASGDLKWRAGAGPASYASPTRVELGGVRQILVFDQQGLAGLAADGAGELWRFEWRSEFDINAAQPLALDDHRVLITSATGVALLDVVHEGDRWEAKEIWRSRDLKASYANPVVRDGFIYGLDEGILVCVDLETGKRRWKKGRHGHGQLLLSGDLLVVLAETGQLVLVEATPKKYHELASFQALEGKTWNNPILVDGKAYVRNHLEMACYDLTEQASKQQ